MRLRMSARPTCAGFTPIELVAVLAIIGVLVALVGVSVTSMIASARRDTALGQVATVFRAAQTAALATNQERRVVVRVTYQDLGTAASLAEIYSEGPRVDFWVERKRAHEKGWYGLVNGFSNYSEPLDDPQSLPQGVFLTDIDGGRVIPRDLSLGKDNGDGTRSVYLSFYFARNGEILGLDARGNPQDTEPLGWRGRVDGVGQPMGNIAIHVTVTGLVISMKGATPPVPDFDYLGRIDGIAEAWDPDLTGDSLRNTLIRDLDQLYGKDIRFPIDAESKIDHEFVGLPQVQTLFLLHLTGLAVSLDYGYYDPWPRIQLKDQDEGGGGA